MPRFYFHLLNDVDVCDREGVELPDLASAREHACRNLRFTAAEVVKEQGKIVPNHRIEIADADGKVLGTVYVGDVVKVETDRRYALNGVSFRGH